MGSGTERPPGRSLSCSSADPGIGLTAWLRAFGPAVAPLPPVTSGPASGILLASMFSWGGRCAVAGATHNNVVALVEPKIFDFFDRHSHK